MFQRFMRVLRHRWVDSAERTLSPQALASLTQRVASSECSHSGEIRICIEAGLPNRVLLQPDSLPTLIRQRAVFQFGALGVWDTESNNGVLIYLLLAERAIELVADRGITSRVPPDHWQKVVERLGAALHEGQFEEGLSHAINEIGVLLERHYPIPRTGTNVNELPDSPTLR